jgi:hypothetical protein
MNSVKEGNLFVWREAIRFDPRQPVNLPSIYKEYNRHCPFCKSKYVRRSNPLFLKYYDVSAGVDRSDEDLWKLKGYRCPFCGFAYETEEVWSLERGIERHTGVIAVLSEFNLNDSRVGLTELGSHLRRKFSDIYSLTPRKFEELVGQVYRELGYSVRLTAETRDGGFDLLLLERSSSDQIIVECKRYSRERRVTVGLVRQVLGVQLALGTKRAKIVATTEFTEPALKLAQQVNLGSSGFELELIDVDAITCALGVFNTDLPPLNLNPKIGRAVGSGLQE